ncbi:hypothetical protein HHI36_000059 [Cryptolaemus montrouzieri]|uniref:Uncharacterized protein n=1 Tax=Cryptolaemus montrouzieri TaxID=559131 RepID=A0ABD2P3V3_9CUCU
MSSRDCRIIADLITAKLMVPCQTSRSATRTGLVPEEQRTSISEDERKIHRLDLLQQESIKHLCQRKLDSALAEAPLSGDTQKEYSNIKLALNRVAHEALE